MHIFPFLLIFLIFTFFLSFFPTNIKNKSKLNPTDLDPICFLLTNVSQDILWWKGRDMTSLATSHDQLPPARLSELSAHLAIMATVLAQGPEAANELAPAGDDSGL
jgi:hypothetical protein